ncbi:hypothetical protein [Streptomyces fodineus]|uniref:hypothetical protein n=1 Tax=Streptomyces fodineus TaxID=1904616 RepID=UPI00131C5D3D|nr:hypothetical protein [Streptomyces fodineus]
MAWDRRAAELRLPRRGFGGVVEEGEGLVGLQVKSGQGAGGGPYLSHGGGRKEALAGDFTDHQCSAGAGQGEGVEPTASPHRGRHVPVRGFHGGPRVGVVQQQVTLDRRSDVCSRV